MLAVGRVGGEGDGPELHLGQKPGEVGRAALQLAARAPHQVANACLGQQVGHRRLFGHTRRKGDEAHDAPLRSARTAETAGR